MPRKSTRTPLTTFRLEPHIKQKIADLQTALSEPHGTRLSEAEVVRRAVGALHESKCKRKSKAS